MANPSEAGARVMYREVNQCRICQNSQLVEVLDLGMQALTGVFPRSKTQRVTAGPLRLVKCIGDENVCGLLQLQHTYDLVELYGDNYGYRSGLNPSMVAHLQQKVRKILDCVDLPDGALIIDIGSNDGTTLKAYPSRGCTLVGIDPTGAKFRAFYPQHVELIPEFFSAETVRRHFGSRKASIVTSFSMFYDLEQPLQFMQEIEDILDDQGIWVLEQSYMPAMLQRNSYDTVCHEHLEYYALTQIKWMADKAGLRIVNVEFNDINGGSFSVTVAKHGSRHTQSPLVVAVLREETAAELDTVRPYREFAARVADNRRSLRVALDRAKRSSKTVAALGASTKGNVVLQYCDITQADVAVVGEVNPDKVGAFTPGTLIPIAAEHDVLAAQPDYLLVLPWHFRDFFLEQPRFSGRTLLFPLPTLDIVRAGERCTTASG